MRILFLDDDQIRHDKFRELINNRHEIHAVYTAKECIDCLKLRPKYDMIFLDHDLGGRQFVESGYETGYQVAQWLQQHPALQAPTMIIHSFNPIGAKQMNACIPKAIRFPINMVYTDIEGVLNEGLKWLKK